MPRVHNINKLKFHSIASGLLNLNQGRTKGGSPVVSNTVATGLGGSHPFYWFRNRNWWIDAITIASFVVSSAFAYLAWRNTDELRALNCLIRKSDSTNNLLVGQLTTLRDVLSSVGEELNETRKSNKHLTGIFHQTEVSISKLIRISQNQDKTVQELISLNQIQYRSIQKLDDANEMSQKSLQIVLQKFSLDRNTSLTKLKDLIDSLKIATYERLMKDLSLRELKALRTIFKELINSNILIDKNKECKNKLSEIIILIDELELINNKLTSKDEFDVNMPQEARHKRESRAVELRYLFEHMYSSAIGQIERIIRMEGN